MLELSSREMFPVHSEVGFEDTVNSTWHPRALLPERKVHVMVTLSPSTSTDADCTSVVSAYGRVNCYELVKFKGHRSTVDHLSKHTGTRGVQINLKCSDNCIQIVLVYIVMSNFSKSSQVWKDRLKH